MVNFPLVHGYRSDQAKPAMAPSSSAVSKGISGRQRPKVSYISGKLVAPVNGPLANARSHVCVDTYGPSTAR